MLKDTNSSKVVYVTAVDAAGAINEFNLAEEAFLELFGAAGVHAGHGTAEWEAADASKCKGNKGTPTYPKLP